jgi:hypothetical protein
MSPYPNLFHHHRSQQSNRNSKDVEDRYYTTTYLWSILPLAIGLLIAITFAVRLTAATVRLAAKARRLVGLSCCCCWLKLLLVEVMISAV